jgi:hypothetical protein
MSLKFFSILVVIFLIGCSTTPIKYDKPIKAEDYKHFYKLEEEKDNPVSKKTFTQKVKEAFSRKPKVDTGEVQKPQTNKVQTKKSTPLSPKRRVRKTNTRPITNEIPVLQQNTRPDDTISIKRDTGKTVMLYLIYLQALIILIFAVMILRRQKKAKNIIVKKGELNL